MDPVNKPRVAAEEVNKWTKEQQLLWAFGDAIRTKEALLDALDALGATHPEIIPALQEQARIAAAVCEQDLSLEDALQYVWEEAQRTFTSVKANAGKR